ncbi:hypothetical protein CEK28_08825 [Xenophilus sp. AP218F]|nr:hypothetical protein CEK28_08825 [Xenophilus sp. AP218F]
MDWKTAGKKGLRGVVRIVFPFQAIIRSVELTRDQVDQHRANMGRLKAMWGEARATLQDEQVTPPNGQSFQQAIAHRAPEALSVAELYRFFLRRKRWALAFAFGFFLVNLVPLTSALAHHLVVRVLFSLAAIVVSSAVLFVIALGAELRLWQLRTQRLSVEEHGGLNDLMATPGWIWQVLDPEIRFKRSTQPNDQRGEGA